MESIYAKYAKLLVNYSLELKKGDKLLIMSSYLAEDLLKEVFREVLQAGAHPEFRVTLNGTGKMLYDYGSNEQLSYISPVIQYALENYDAYLVILAPFNLKELENITAEKKQIFAMARAELTKTILKRSATGELKSNLCVFPTDAAAQECDMSKSEYEDFVFSACFLYEDDPIAKWRNAEEYQQRIIEHLNGRENIQYLGRDIDISFSTKGRT